MKTKKKAPSLKTVADAPTPAPPNIFDDIKNLFEANRKTPSQETEQKIFARLQLLQQTFDGMHIVGYQAGIRAAANFSSQFSENQKEATILEHFGLRSINPEEELPIAMRAPIGQTKSTKKKK